VGLVSGATFADLDGAGQPDLALAVEWGPVRVYRNNKGHFEEMTVPWGLAGRTGWWTSVTAGDFDGDGRMDLAVGNWGRNSSYELYQPTKLRVFYGDWDASGNIAVLEAWEREGNWFPVRNRLFLASAMPELANQFTTHDAFGKATVQDILGARYGKANILEATELESGV